MSRYESNIWKLYAFKFLRNMLFMGGVLVPFYLEWGKISFFQIMLLQSIFVFSISAFEVPTGAIADLFGRKVSLALAAIATASAALVYSSYPAFWVFVIAELLWALGFALMSGADEALLYDTLRETGDDHKAKQIFGRWSSIEIVALMISAPIGSIIGAYLGLRYSVMLMAVPLFLAFLVSLTMKEPPIISEQKDFRGYVRTISEGIGYFRGHKILRILAFDKITIAVLVFFIVWTYQPLLTDLGVPIVYFGFIGAIALTGVQIPVMNNFASLERWSGSRKRYLLWSAIIPGMCFILLGFNRSVAFAIILIILISAFGLSRYVLFQSYMNRHIISSKRATVISAISVIDRFARGILYLIIGLLVQYSLYLAFVIIGTAIIAAALTSSVKEEHLLD